MSIFRYIWRFIIRGLLPLIAASVRLRCFAARYCRWRAGNCLFYGPRDFLDVCSNAVDLLAKLDPPLYRSLLAQHITFWYEPKGFVLLERHCGIPKSFLLWREQGVLACLVFEYFEREWALKRPFVLLALVDRRIVWQQIYAAARSWLKKHDFLDELVQCFSYGCESPS